MLLLFVSAAIVACNKSDDDGGEEGEQQEQTGSGELFTATVDGTNFAADTDPATLIGGTLSTSGGTTVLAGQGSTNDGKFINFQIIGFNGTGTYVTADDLTNPNMIMYGELQGTTTASAWNSSGIAASSGAIQPGEIVVTAQTDTMAEGTFSFEGYNAEDMTVKTVTNGKFKITFDN